MRRDSVMILSWSRLFDCDWFHGAKTQTLLCVITSKWLICDGSTNKVL